ncbi:hypothetical protein [Hydrogenophaga sp. 2FB]|uniref:hypothetical protein n=1 Tax=Hydrogenophaga sp. 2FB TaxID=2502187 RepID=UPI0010F9E9E4|nr:hypothetical protein [Hydrogenophaga sp. 2FB]
MSRAVLPKHFINEFELYQRRELDHARALTVLLKGTGTPDELIAARRTCERLIDKGVSPRFAGRQATDKWTGLALEITSKPWPKSTEEDLKALLGAYISRGMVELIPKFIQSDSKAPYHSTVLDIAAMQGHTQAVRLIVDVHPVRASYEANPRALVSRTAELADEIHHASKQQGLSLLQKAAFEDRLEHQVNLLQDLIDAHPGVYAPTVIATEAEASARKIGTQKHAFRSAMTRLFAIALEPPQQVTIYKDLVEAAHRGLKPTPVKTSESAVLAESMHRMKTPRPF